MTIKLTTEDTNYIEDKLANADESTFESIVGVLNCDHNEWGQEEIWYDVFKETLKQSCVEMGALNWRALEAYCFTFYREDRVADGEMTDMEDRLIELRKELKSQGTLV